MALYVPAGARRRRLVLIALAGLVGGLAVGFVLGRSTAQGLGDRVDAVKVLAADATTALERIPIEYEQALAGAGGESTATISGAVDRARAQLDDAYAEAIWFGPDATAATDDAFDAVTEAVVDEVEAAELEAAIDDAVTAIETTFALTS